MKILGIDTIMSPKDLGGTCIETRNQRDNILMNYLQMFFETYNFIITL